LGLRHYGHTEARDREGRFYPLLERSHLLGGDDSEAVLDSFGSTCCPTSMGLCTTT
jgi:hypothetical protein